jgi:hypothetical protein
VWGPGLYSTINRKREQKTILREYINNGKGRDYDKVGNYNNYDKLGDYKAFGGLRIEDDLVITEAGSRILGIPLPVSASEIELIRR